MAKKMRLTGFMPFAPALQKRGVFRTAYTGRRLQEYMTQE